MKAKRPEQVSLNLKCAKKIPNEANKGKPGAPGRVKGKKRTGKRSAKPYKVVSLFSGCGGLDLGFLGNFAYRNRFFEENQFRIEFANDIDPAAELVYNANGKFFNGHKLHCKDIKNVKHEEIPDFDFLIAGFPCQPFSNAGLRKGIHDERGNLFEECENLLKEAKPKYLRG